MADEKVTEVPKLLKDVSQRQYLPGNLLGTGGFATCWKTRMIDRREAPEAAECALKAVKAVLPKKIALRFKLELAIQSKLRHPNVVELYRAFTYQDVTYVALELCPNGSLTDMVKRRKFLTMGEIRRILIQLCGAVKYLHQRDVVHRDIKAGNIFLDENMNIKLGDFGLAAIMERGDTLSYARRTTFCGTPNYLAPEILCKGTGHGISVDIWAIGILAYYLAVGRAPFHAKSKEEIYERLRKGEYSWPELSPEQNEIPEDLRSLVSSLLVEEERRPSPDQIVKHQFFTRGFIPPKLDPLCLTRRPKWARVGTVQENYETYLELCRASRVGVAPVPGNVKTKRAEMKSLVLVLADEFAQGIRLNIPLPEGYLYTGRLRPSTNAVIFEDEMEVVPEKLPILHSPVRERVLAERRANAVNSPAIPANVKDVKEVPLEKGDENANNQQMLIVASRTGHALSPPGKSPGKSTQQLRVQLQIDLVQPRVVHDRREDPLQTHLAQFPNSPAPRQRVPGTVQQHSPGSTRLASKPVETRVQASPSAKPVKPQMTIEPVARVKKDSHSVRAQASQTTSKKPEPMSERLILGTIKSPKHKERRIEQRQVEKSKAEEIIIIEPDLNFGVTVENQPPAPHPPTEILSVESLHMEKPTQIMHPSIAGPQPPAVKEPLPSNPTDMSKPIRRSRTKPSARSVPSIPVAPLAADRQLANNEFSNQPRTERKNTTTSTSRRAKAAMPVTILDTEAALPTPAAPVLQVDAEVLLVPQPPKPTNPVEAPTLRALQRPPRRRPAAQQIQPQSHPLAEIQLQTQTLPPLPLTTYQTDSVAATSPSISASPSAKKPLTIVAAAVLAIETAISQNPTITTCENTDPAALISSKEMRRAASVRRGGNLNQQDNAALRSTIREKLKSVRSGLAAQEKEENGAIGLDEPAAAAAVIIGRSDGVERSVGVNTQKVEVQTGIAFAAPPSRRPRRAGVNYG